MKIRIENIMIALLLILVLGAFGVLRYGNIQYKYEVVVTGTEDGCACAYEVWKSRANHKRVDGIMQTTFRNEHIIYTQDNCSYAKESDLSIYTDEDIYHINSKDLHIFSETGVVDMFFPDHDSMREWLENRTASETQDSIY
jgi:hypothetical protein